MPCSQDTPINQVSGASRLLEPHMLAIGDAAGLLAGRYSTAPESAQPLPSGASPQAIRAALLPEEAGNFDREYRREMVTAIETFDLTPVIEMLARWQLVARSSQDPRAHRQMLAHAEMLNAGGDIPRTPWRETKARLGLS